MKGDHVTMEYGRKKGCQKKEKLIPLNKKKAKTPIYLQKKGKSAY